MRQIATNAKPYWMPGLAMIGVIALLLVTIARSTVFAVQPNSAGDWSTFMGNNARTGYNANETIINRTTAPNLKLHWSTPQSGGQVTSEVLAVNGLLYWGAWNGIMHATDAATGKDVWTQNLGTKPASCSGLHHGLVGTPTVATVSINGVAKSVVFVGGGQDNVTALDAKTGQIIWQTNLGNDPAEFLYSSTAVYNGSVYIGVASSGDCPLVPGQMVQVNASTGAIQHTFTTSPAGCLGADAWGSPTIDEATGMLYFGTGNIDHLCKKPAPFALAVVELKASDLSLVDSWTVPTSDAIGDGDFGSTPTLFNATINHVAHHMLGLVNKNGYYYALDRDNIAGGALWKARISVGGRNPYTNASISSSAYDGKRLYVEGSLTTIGGQSCPGGLRSVNPNTGAFRWEKCLAAAPLGSVIAAPGLVVVGAGDTLLVVNSGTGQILFSYQDTSTKGNFKDTATISNGMLYDGSWSGKVFAFGL